MGIATQTSWGFQFGLGTDLTAELEAEALGPMTLGLVEEMTLPSADIADIFLIDPNRSSSASAFLFAESLATTAVRFGGKPKHRREAMLASGLASRQGDFDGEQQSGTIIELGDGTIEEISEALARTYPRWFEGKEIARNLENVRIVLPEDLPTRMFHWGYRAQKALCEDEARWCNLIKKRLDGQELTEEDRALLENFHRRYQAEAENNARRFYFWGTILKELAIGDSTRCFQERPLVRARHDVGTIMRGFRSFSLQTREFEKWVLFYQEYPRQLVIRNSAGGTLGDLLTAQAAIGAGEKINLRVGDTYPYLLEQYTLVNDIDRVIAISNIFLNLFSNAARYADSKKQEGAVVTFGSSLLSGGSIQIKIKDNGIGIKKENLARLGEEGFREVRIDVDGSQGIGLSSVIATLNSLGVPFWVRSEEGVGTEFRFLLPGWLLMKNGEPVAVRDDFAEDLAHALEQNGSKGFVIPSASQFTRK